MPTGGGSRAARDRWRAKFPGTPFDLIMIRGVHDDASFPPKMMVDDIPTQVFQIHQTASVQH
jgi:hypothetical protein